MAIEPEPGRRERAGLRHRPAGLSEVLWRAIAAGTPGVGPDGGWESGYTPKSAFVPDTTKTYRFAVPVLRTSGTGNHYWGPAWSTVCNINTTTPEANPYFVATDGLPSNNWVLLVGYVFPAGSTGMTNAGAGIYDMESGALLEVGNNFCWVAAAQDCSTRTYQIYASTGSTTYWAKPVVEVLDGYEAARITYIGEGSVNTPNVASYAITNGAVLASGTTVGSTGSPGASVTVILMIGPTLDVSAEDELDFTVNGVAELTFWSQAALGRVEVFLKYRPPGGSYTEIGTRRRYATPVDIYTNALRVSMDKTEFAFVPGVGEFEYHMECRITWINAAGNSVMCQDDFTADAEWRVVVRKK
jgi:hypothetical protein